MAAGNYGAGNDGRGGGGRMVWKEEEMYRWQIDVTARKPKDLIRRPMQEVKFEFKQSLATGGARFSWIALIIWGMQKRSTREMRFTISLETFNSECDVSISDERLYLKVENAVGTKIFEGTRDNVFHCWTFVVTEKTFNELQTHGGVMIVTFILKTKISAIEKIYWPSEIAIKDSFYKMISKLENDEENSDLKIITSDGTEFFAYRWILAHVSEVFEAMFRSEMSEKQSGVLKLDDLGATTVKILLHFIYTGEVAIEEWSCAGTVEELMYAADKYQIGELKNFFDAKLGAICTAQNAGALLAMAEKTSLKKAVADILSFIKEQCNDPKAFFEIVKNTKTD